ncbi:hypothetical protein ARMGADRAFT_1010632, partial [Armillaria gallica]
MHIRFASLSSSLNGSGFILAYAWSWKLASCEDCYHPVIVHCHLLFVMVPAGAAINTFACHGISRNM